MNHTGTVTSAPADNIVDAAKKLIGMGYAVTPVHGKTKQAKLKGWPDKQIAIIEVEQHFSPSDNLAIVLGEMSGGLIDVDFDHPMAKCFATYLPKTAMTHGRPGNPLSHYWYRVEGSTKTAKFSASDGKVLIELRSTGCLTMVPPSVHPEGDHLQWVQAGPPATVDGTVLAASVSKIAAATLLAANWPKKGNRNDAALALAGALLRAGWDVLGTAGFIRDVAKAAGDEEHETRGACANTTASKLQAGEPVTGMPKLSTLLGADVVSRIADWLCLDKTPNQHESIDAIVEELNQRHAVVSVGGGTWILNEGIDPATGASDVTLSRPNDFRLKYKNQQVTIEGKPFVISDIWLEHPQRREYDGIEFAPTSPHAGFYNLFRGFAVVPVPGDCALYLSHVHDNICKGDEVIYEYVISWMAHAIQCPGVLPGTALVLRGAQGVGKGVFVDNFGQLFGQHYLTVYRLSQITGRFNGHMKNLLLVHANEAVWGGHKEAEGALKGLVTDPMMPIEAKGKDIIQIRNYKRLICSSNEQWAVPLDLDDRRFLVLDVSSAHKEDHAYFAAIEDQMASGGQAALMHHLATRDLSGFNVRKLPPTHMAFDLKLMSATPATNWWYEQLLAENTFCGGLFEKSDVYMSYQNWCHAHKKHHFALLAPFCKELQKLVPTLKTEKHKVAPASPLFGKEERKNFFKFPSKDECRKHFEALTKSGSEIWDM